MSEVKQWVPRYEKINEWFTLTSYKCPRCDEWTETPLVHTLGHISMSDPSPFTTDCTHDYKRLQKNGDRIFYACEHCGATKVEREEEQS